MNPKLKAFAREWLPPAALRILLTRNPWRIRFRGHYPSWSAARAASSGYDRASILDKVKEATLKVKSGEAVYERDSMLFDHVEYSWPVLAALMWSAAINGGRLSLLDFGGSLGSAYFQNRAFLNRLEDFQWGIVEQAHYVETGQQLIADDRLRFFPSIEECVSAISPNTLLLGSVLHYVESYRSQLEKLTAFRPSVIAVDRTIVNEGASDRIYVQDVPPVVYEASYPVYSLSEPSLVSTFDRLGYQLVTDFDAGSFPAAEATGSKFKGYIFFSTSIR